MGKRVHYGSQFNTKVSFQNKKKELVLFPHPEVHFCERKNKEYIPKDVKVRRDTIHIFGVDFFSEGDLLDFFKEFNPLRVEWINDSSCNLIFPDYESASAAIFSKTTQIDDKDHDLDWRRGLDIDKDGKSFNFMIRFSTDQVRPAHSRTSKTLRQRESSPSTTSSSSSRASIKRRYSACSSRVSIKRFSKEKPCPNQTQTLNGVTQ